MKGSTTFDVVIENKSGDEDEYEVCINFFVQPAEPDVGITRPFLEEFQIESISQVLDKGSEKLHPDNYPFDEKFLDKTESIEEIVFKHIKD